MNTIEYKGYVGKFSLEPGDEMFHGQVLGIRDVVHFRGGLPGVLRPEGAAA
jgi:predicted HicB family RNase H-like nuclease